MTTKTTEKTTAAPAVEQAARVMICLGESPSFRMNLTDICRIVGIHKSKGHSILSALVKYGFVQKDLRDKTYSLGPGILSLSRKVLDNLNYSQLVGPSLEALAKSTNATALFGVIADESLMVVARREVDTGIGITISIGHRLPATWGAHGTAIFSFLNERERKKTLARKKLYFHGEPAGFDSGRLEREAEGCRKNGYAVDIGRMNAGINAISSPVFGAGQSPIGALFILGTFPEAMAAQYGPLVAQKAVEISRLFGAETGSIFGTIGSRE